MSFSSDLWHSLDLVQKHSKERRKAQEELIQLLRERAMYEDFYAQGMERLSAHPFVVTSQGSLAKVVAAMKEECALRATAAKQLSKEIVSELVESLQRVLREQNEEVKTVASRVKSARKELDAQQKALARAQNTYKEQFHLSEEFVVKVEAVRSTSEKKRILTSQTEDINNTMRFALKSYKDAIAAYNLCLPRYREALSEVLNAYQRQEERRLRAMGEALAALWEKGRSATDKVRGGSWQDVCGT